MNNDLKLTIDHIRSLVDTYGAGAHPLPDLIEMRRDLAVYLFRLSSHVKSTYGGKLKSYIRRKHGVARAIITAMEEDIKVMGKAKAMNFYDTATEALDHVRQAKTEEAEADAEWEEVRLIVDLGKRILDSMSQEISDLKIEKSNPSYTNTGA
jgi:hypothetical protein